MVKWGREENRVDFHRRCPSWLCACACHRFRVFSHVKTGSSRGPCHPEGLAFLMAWELLLEGSGVWIGAIVSVSKVELKHIAVFAALLFRSFVSVATASILGLIMLQFLHLIWLVVFYFYSFISLTLHTFALISHLYQMNLSLKKVHMPFKRVVIISFFGSYNFILLLTSFNVRSARTAFDANVECQWESVLMLPMVSTLLS